MGSVRQIFVTIIVHQLLMLLKNTTRSKLSIWLDRVWSMCDIVARMLQA